MRRSNQSRLPRSDADPPFSAHQGGRVEVYRYNLDPQHPDMEILHDCAAAIRAGRVLLCPTDTCYILAANGLDLAAVTTVFEIKGRSFQSAIHIIVPDEADAEKYGIFNTMARALAQQFLPGRLTIVVNRQPIVPDVLVGNLPTVGIRIPDNKIILLLAQLAGVPLTATSANHSGSGTPYTVDEALADLGQDAELIYAALDQGELERVPTSTLVDVAGETPGIIREGAIPGNVLLRFLEKAAPPT